MSCLFSPSVAATQSDHCPHQSRHLDSPLPFLPPRPTPLLNTLRIFFFLIGIGPVPTQNLLETSMTLTTTSGCLFLTNITPEHFSHLSKPFCSSQVSAQVLGPPNTCPLPISDQSPTLRAQRAIPVLKPHVPTSQPLCRDLRLITYPGTPPKTLNLKCFTALVFVLLLFLKNFFMHLYFLSLSL